MGIKGGRRPGAGRKKGSKNAATKKREEMIARSVDAGISPLEYMLAQMRVPIPEDADPLVQVHIRSMKFEAAKAAAPYVHPRLNAIEHTGKDGAPIEVGVKVYMPSSRREKHAA